MLLAVPFGLLIGVSLGALGGGGAVLALPVLVYVLGQDVHAATTGSLGVVAAAALAGGAAQSSRARVCWPQVGLFAPAALAGAAVGTLASEAVSATFLLLGFAGLLLTAAAVTWRRADATDEIDRACPPLARKRAVGAGVVLGLLTGLFGVGGGFLVVPMLVLAMDFPLRRAISTSLVIVGVVSLGAFAAHLWRSSEVDAPVIAVMAAACAMGTIAGARVAEILPQRLLGHAFAVLLSGVAASMAVAAAT